MTRAAGAVFAVTALFVCPACSRPATALPVLGVVPAFELTDQDGRAFRGENLRGKAWVADFIYTNCPGPCPLMSRRMQSIAERLASEPRARLVSFSIDPARDTPDALRKYAARYRADLTRWSFLTGLPAVLDHLDFDVFRLGHLTPDLEHSTRFPVVDPQGRIRAYHNMSETDMTNRIADDIATILREKS